jgi:hypothetical protein
MKFKSLKSVVRLLMIASLSFGLASCIKVDTSSSMPTMGSELIDLSRAKELGKLTDEEFKIMRRKVLASF